MHVQSVIFILAGVLTWPITEYVLHRFLGHELRLKTLFRREHQTHHAVKDFFAPVYYKIIAALVVVLAMLFLKAPLVYAISFISMYLFYEYTHYSFHRFAPRTKWGRAMRKHHFYHHFMNAKKNYGVTTSWFDRLANTGSENQIVKVPRKFAMVWLLDEVGNVRKEYKGDFTCVIQDDNGF